MRVVALAAPTEREKTQWYFQRYVEELPAAGEMVLFDRSWYNRAGVERVMGFCTEDEVWEFFRTCPEFERMLIRSGVILVKYWFASSDDEQERRFQARIKDPLKRWKLSDMDLESRNRWVEYSKAKDEMFSYTDTKDSPWWVVNADDKKRARLNCIHHLLSMIPYEDVVPKPFKLPPRKPATRATCARRSSRRPSCPRCTEVQSGGRTAPGLLLRCRPAPSAQSVGPPRDGPSSNSSSATEMEARWRVRRSGSSSDTRQARARPRDGAGRWGRRGARRRRRAQAR